MTCEEISSAFDMRHPGELGQVRLWGSSGLGEDLNFMLKRSGSDASHAASLPIVGRPQPAGMFHKLVIMRIEGCPGQVSLAESAIE
jgi:hypothetical protein